MKKLMIGAAVAALCCSAIVGYCDTTSGNIVGYQGYTIKKGIQKIELRFKEVGSDAPVTVGSLLPSAIAGDHIFCEKFHYLAKVVDGKLHWTRQGKIVDDYGIPAGKFTFTYLRKAKQETVLTISGEVSGELLEEAVSMPSPQPATPAPKNKNTPLTSGRKI